MGKITTFPALYSLIDEGSYVPEVAEGDDVPGGRRGEVGSDEDPVDRSPRRRRRGHHRVRHPGQHRPPAHRQSAAGELDGRGDRHFASLSRTLGLLLCRRDAARRRRRPLGRLETPNRTPAPGSNTPKSIPIPIPIPIPTDNKNTGKGRNEFGTDPHAPNRGGRRKRERTRSRGAQRGCEDQRAGREGIYTARQIRWDGFGRGRRRDGPAAAAGAQPPRHSWHRRRLNLLLLVVAA
jgi:hypothetical protein